MRLWWTHPIYYKVLEQLGTPAPKIDERLEHIMATGMIGAFFEMVLHRMPFEDAKIFLRQLNDFYTAGWVSGVALKMETSRWLSSGKLVAPKEDNIHTEILKGEFFYREVMDGRRANIRNSI